MKTTVELDDVLLRRAKERAAREGSSLRSLIERSLQRLLEEDDAAAAEYVLPDLSVGGDGPDPALRDGSGWLALAYEGRGT